MITMRTIYFMLRECGLKEVETTIAKLAMNDVFMTDRVVQYGIHLGILLPDYKCGWNKA